MPSSSPVCPIERRPIEPANRGPEIADPAIAKTPDRDEVESVVPQNDRLYDRDFVIALVSQTCFVMANTLMAHFSRWIEFLGGDLRQVGLIMGSAAMLGLLLRPWMAQWINRIGARAMWGVGYGVFAISSLSNLFLHELGPAIYLTRGGIVLGAAIVFASGLTFVSQTAPAHRRTEAIGILGVGGFLGMLLGPAIGDMFLGSDVRHRVDFVWLFSAATIANLLPACLLLFLHAPHSVGDQRPARLREFFATVRAYWPGTILLVDLAFGVCITAPLIFVASFVDTLHLQIPGLSVIGLFFWCYAGVAIVVRVGFRRLPDVVGPDRVLLVGTVFMSLGMFAFSVVSTEKPWLIVIPALLGGVGHSLMFHTMVSLTLIRFPRKAHGTGSTLALMMLDLGTILGAPILGLIGQSFGFGVLFAAIGLFCLGSASVYAISRRRHRTPVERTGPKSIGSDQPLVA
ncbi:MFS transporter [Novipirellula artificiosorum]|uniref:Major facilitator superfamily transporter n=1 Tax=Novipirellula artificiosorum TaxID=2528016 RepID=A0A5C6DA51_9BACT|nr:MFS transporter [Novipirellula artificiosorum]TWU33770.1 major facilitator superfamily transporter [Novipirellula artificiosorum]